MKLQIAATINFHAKWLAATEEGAGPGLAAGKWHHESPAASGQHDQKGKRISRRIPVQDNAGVKKKKAVS